MLWSVTDLWKDKERLQRDCSCLGSWSASTSRQWTLVRLEAWIWTTAEVDPWRKTYRTVIHEQPLTLYKTHCRLTHSKCMYVAVDVNTQKLPAHMLVNDHEHPNPPHQDRIFPFNARYSRLASVYILHRHLMAPFLAYFPESSESYPDSKTTNKRFYCKSSSKHQIGKFLERGLSYWNANAM